MFELGILPIVTIDNTDLPYNESKQLYNFDSVDVFNPRIKEIRTLSALRKDPAYEHLGKGEHIELLKEAAKTVRENLILEKGVLNRKR